MSVSVATRPFNPLSSDIHRPVLSIPSFPVKSSGSPRPLPPIPYEIPPSQGHREPIRNRNTSGSPMHTKRQSSCNFPSTPPEVCSFVSVMKNPSTLAAILSYLGWLDFLAISATSTHCWRLFRDLQLRDIVLSKFVPGFRYLLRHRDLPQFKEVALSIHDLNVFMASQSMPLHFYPIHSINIQSSILPSLEHDEMSQKYIALAEAHSRVVLLLQSYAHSSSSLPPPETKESSPSSRFMAQFQSPAIPPYHPRELSFPAPLSYKPSSAPATPRSPKNVLVPLGKPPQMRSSSARAAIPTRQSNTLTRGKRMSIFGGGSLKADLPPPSDPTMLKAYSSSWRRTLFHSSGGLASDDEDAPLERPHGRFASDGRLASSDSGSSSGFGSQESGAAMRPPPSPVPFLSPSSPHDIRLATSRLRAPVIRVFHPCNDLLEDGDAIQQCEDQLINSGLWNHLSTGDVVVNLGYIPPTDDASSSPATQWLLFNGSVLVPYNPPVQSIPLTSNPFSLPSPFYYSHIYPPSTSPIFNFPRFPKIDVVPQLTLVHVSTKVPSRRSPEGYMWVKRYAWTARVDVHRGVGFGSTTTTEDQMGLGWLGEWILQGDGTKEGRNVLMDCLRGLGSSDGKPMRWEVVREKSGGGRVWFRLLDSVPHPFLH